MKIDINKDFEESFPHEVYSGFTLPQCIAVVAGLLFSFTVAFILWKFLKMPIVECTYLAVPLMIPVCAAGFFTYQKQSLAGLVRAMVYTKQTALLSYKAGECAAGKEKVFSLGQKNRGPADKNKERGKAGLERRDDPWR